MSRTLIIFTRAPVAGKVKSRLIPALGPEGAARLHENLVRQCVRNTTQPGRWWSELHCSPTTGHPFFKALSDAYRLETHSQWTGDLGRRMSAAMRTALKRTEHVVIVGTDCPTLCATDVHDAFQALLAGNDAVIGPAEDGGYYLIGLRRTDDRLFTDMPWGSDRVLDITRSRLAELGWAWVEVAVRWDVDRPEDLVRLRADPRLRHLAAGMSFTPEIGSEPPSDAR